MLQNKKVHLVPAIPEYLEQKKIFCAIAPQFLLFFTFSEIFAQICRYLTQYIKILEVADVEFRSNLRTNLSKFLKKSKNRDIYGALVLVKFP